MSDKDRKAFEDWFSGCELEVIDDLRIWQAACEYKDKEQYIEGSIHESGGIKREMTWKESSDMMENMYKNSIVQLDREHERIRKLQAENRKMREALEEISKSRSLLKFHDTLTKDAELAMKTLKEVGEV